METMFGQDKANYINHNLREKWDKTSQYFYPLDSCSRNDVIAFDKKYIDDKRVQTIIDILIKHQVKYIYELWEDGRYFEKKLCRTENFWESNEYLWYNEGYWFDNNFDWIIYSSHEQIITFGGKWLIEIIKYEWKNWKDMLKWDTKNT